jgi:hypothetical protein
MHYRTRVPSQRFPYRIHLAEDKAIVTMDCGEGVYRNRTMPLWLLRSVTDICRTCAGAIDQYREERLLADDVPTLPDCTPIITIPLGPCVANVVASRNKGGTVEISVAFYDAGDDRAPALLLTEEQIPEFADAAEKLLDNGTG